MKRYVDAQFQAEEEFDQDKDEFAQEYVSVQQWIQWRSSSLDNLLTYLHYMRSEEEFALNWLSIPKIHMVELQDLSDDVLAIKVSSLEVEKGKSKAVTKDKPTIDPREVEREFRRATKRASRISIAEKAMEGPRQTNGAAAEEEERPILMIEAAPPSLNEVPARGEPGTEDQSPLFARNAQEESARGESNASAEDEARLVPKSVILFLPSSSPTSSNFKL
nr:uncharacterized protein LOC109167327 [Ipomoea trifida]